jgi:hypothetical protein
MHIHVPSYEGQTFIVLDNDARIRNPNNLGQFSRYKEGDQVPQGSRIGDHKIIPQHTPITVHDVRIDSSRNTYVLAQPLSGSPSPSGWTKATNLEGQFVNEIVSYGPAEWDLAPNEDNFTVTDGNSLIRTPPPEFRSLGRTIEVGTYVVVTARSRQTDPEGRFVRVSRGRIEAASILPVEPIGWTAASNLTEGCSPVFATDVWSDITGPNACWKSGDFIGAKILVNIAGTGGQMEQITLDSMLPYFRLTHAAAGNNITIALTSGFRTFEKQKKLFEKFQAGAGNLAAKPGRSNHQNGVAFDLNTGGFDGHPVYDWLKKNGPKQGFIRTVNREHWHWEYRPKDAKRLRAEGKFALSRVRV